MTADNAAPDAVDEIRGWLEGAHDEDLIELEARTLRAVVAEVDQLRDFAPPICANCGERNRNGSYSEHDDSWLCDPCHAKLSRGGDLAPLPRQPAHDACTSCGRDFGLPYVTRGEGPDRCQDCEEGL